MRVITATNRDLEQLVDSKVFREDLFYRINVFRINIPSLRERTGDVRQLAGFFLAKYSDIRPGGRVEGFTAEALAMMEAYPWPGNVRQLENSVERAVYLAEGELVTAAELPPEVRAFRGSGALAGCARGGGRVPLWGRGGGRGGADPGHAPPHPRERHGGGPLAGHQPKNFISKAPTVSHRLQLASDLIYRMTQMKL